MSRRHEYQPLLDSMEAQGYGVMLYRLLPDKVAYMFQGKGYTVKDSVEHRIEQNIIFIKHNGND